MLHILEWIAFIAGATLLTPLLAAAYCGIFILAAWCWSSLLGKDH